MRLVRYGPPGAEKPGLIDQVGAVRALNQHIEDIDFSRYPDLLAQLSSLDPASLPVVATPGRMGPPLAGVGKFIAIGLNYADHAAESGQAVPTEPIVFTKATSCIAGPHDDIVLPPGSQKTDWEVELGIVIGKRASYVGEADALENVAGYLLVNDVSEREYQLERGGTWDKGKGCDSFGPIGPWLATPDEIGDCQSLDMWLDVNGDATQRGNTRTMVFSCAELISYVSRFMTLLPGDIITTGTPPGVGMGFKPPRYLKAGDIVRLGITGLGEQLQRVRATTSGE